MIKGMLPGLGVAFALALTASAATGVVKTKTKSNQSNDRCAGSCPIPRGDVAGALETEFGRLDASKDSQLDGAEHGGLAVSPPGGSEAARGAPLKGVVLSLGDGSARTIQLVFSSALDRNGDGLVSRAEWLADGLAQFDLADGDDDGSLTDGEAARFGWNVKSSETR